MPKMTEADRLRRLENRLELEEKYMSAGINRLDGLKDRRLIEIRLRYGLIRNQISAWKQDVHKELEKGTGAEVISIRPERRRRSRHADYPQSDS